MSGETAPGTPCEPTGRGGEAICSASTRTGAQREPLFTNQLGWEVCLLVGSQVEVVQTHACREQEEVLTTGEEWKQAMIA